MRPQPGGVGRSVRQTKARPMSLDRAKQLRKDMTDAERFAWQRMRYRQIGGHKFRRQVPLGPFVADFVCLECRLIVELDGGQHAERIKADGDRTRWLQGQGFKVLRFWNNDVLRDWDAVAEVIWENVRSLTPHPNPPPQGGREPERNPPLLRGRE